MNPTVSVSGVVKNYRAVRALRDVSFDLDPGRLSALVGHNGAGKTTLIKLMLGLIRPDSGFICVLDEDPAAGLHRHVVDLREGCGAGREELGRAGRAYAARHHAPDVVAAAKRRIYQALETRELLVPTSRPPKPLEQGGRRRVPGHQHHEPGIDEARHRALVAGEVRDQLSVQSCTLDGIDARVEPRDQRGFAEAVQAHLADLRWLKNELFYSTITDAAVKSLS